MPDTRITKERLKNHWLYSSWKYLLMIVIFVAGWNLTYSITEYKPPREKRLEVYFLSTAYVEENIKALEEELAPLFVGDGEDDMEELNFYVVNYGSEDDVYGPQLLMTRLASHEGDIYMVDEQTFASFVAQELATPLDEYIESGALDVTGQDLETVTRAAPAGQDENGNTIYSNERHVYALPAEPLYGFINENIISNSGMYFVVMSYTDKVDKCIELLNVFSERFRADKPDWLIEQEEQQRQEIANLPSELTVDSLNAQAPPAPEATADAAQSQASQSAADQSEAAQSDGTSTDAAAESSAATQPPDATETAVDATPAPDASTEQTAQPDAA